MHRIQVIPVCSVKAESKEIVKRGLLFFHLLNYLPFDVLDVDEVFNKAIKGDIHSNLYQSQPRSINIEA